MALETATYINGLVASNPLSTDPKSQGDDHLRLIKSAIRSTFPNISGAVTASHTELNYVSGVTSGIQAQFNAITAQIAAGTSAALNSITAATGAASINNGSNEINWNWNLGSTAGNGLYIAEGVASTSGATAKALLNVSTPASSFTNPFRVNAGGNTSDSIKVSYAGALSLYAVTTSTSPNASGQGVIVQGGFGSGTGAGGNILIQSGPSGGTGQGGSITISAANSNGGTQGGSITLSGGSGSSIGGDINLQPSSAGTTVGRVNFVNSSVANGTVASAFTASVGPTGASSSILGWLAIKVAGTQRYIPYW